MHRRCSPARSRRAPLLLLLAVLAVGLSGCYVPLSFDADVRISRTGFYELRYTGGLAWAPLWQEIREHRLSRAEQAEKIATIRRDLARDSSASRIEDRGNGSFDIDWRRSGDLLNDRMVTFVRRNERLLALRYSKFEGVIVFEGKSLPADRARALSDAGLRTSGTMTLRTDAPVIEHNAAEVERHAGGITVYRWRLFSAAPPAPRLVIAMR